MKKIIFLSTVLAFSAFVACKTPKNKGDKNENFTPKQLTQEQQLQNTALFLDALKEKYLNNYDKAMGLFAQCLKQNPSNDAAMYEMACLLYETKKYEDALTMIKNASRKKPDNIWYSLLLAQTYEALRKYDDADKVYKSLAEKNPKNIDIYLDWADMHTANGNYSAAIKVYDLLESKNGRQPETTIQKQKLYMMQGKISKAIDEIEALIKLFPKEIQYLGMLAELYQMNGTPLKAIAVYEQMKNINPDDPNVHLSLADYYRLQNQPDKSVEELKIAFASKELNIDTKVKILLSILNQQFSEPAYKNALTDLGRILIEASPEEPKAYSIYGDILMSEKKYGEAREAYRNVIKYDNSKFAVWQQLLQIESMLEDYNAMENEAKTAMELFPEQPETYLFYGVASLMLGKYNQAITALNNGKNFVAGDDKLLLKFYTALADSYYKNNNFDKSFEMFEKSLKIDSNNAYVLNNYSYYLAQQNTNLNRAEQLSQRLVNQYPNNPTYLDTYAWVLFKKNKFFEARKWIEKAISLNTNNPVILEHYGDILFKNNEKDLAVEYWIKARENGQKSEILDKKITTKMYYE